MKNPNAYNAFSAICLLFSSFFTESVTALCKWLLQHVIVVYSFSEKKKPALKSPVKAKRTVVGHLKSQHETTIIPAILLTIQI